jgi:hypothetical protein
MHGFDDRDAGIVRGIADHQNLVRNLQDSPEDLQHDFKVNSLVADGQKNG